MLKGWYKEMETEMEMLEVQEIIKYFTMKDSLYNFIYCFVVVSSDAFRRYWSIALIVPIGARSSLQR